MENFIRIYKADKNLCDKLIKYHQSNIEYKIKGSFNNGNVNIEVKDSIDVCFYNQTQNKDILSFFNILSESIQKYIKEFNIKYPLRTVNRNLIQYYPPKGGYKVFHCENENIATVKIKIVYMLYLNDLKKGGTEFKYQNIKLKAKKGDLIIWPADFTHIHKGIISETEEKYIATGWFEME